MKLKWMYKFVLCIFICFVSGCSNNQDFNMLQNEIDSKQAMLGVAYLGYWDKTNTINEFLDKWHFDTNLSIFESYDQNQIFVKEGNEVYCIIPSKNVSLLEIYSFDLSNYESTNGKGELIYESNENKALFLIGNISDIMPSFYISIKDKDGKVINYSPCLSLKDGSLSIIEGEIIDLNYMLKNK